MTDQIPQIPNKKISKTNFVAAVGRRKEAVARVRLYKGRGEILINDKPITDYFSGLLSEIKWKKPFILTKTEGVYYASIKVKGSGKISQLDAVTLGIARALNQASADFRSPLKKAGLLTRDARVKERRKYGLAQKARKGKQSPKR